MFCGTIWSLTFGRTRREVNKLMITIAILLLVLSTTHIIMDIYRIEQGLVAQRNTFPGGPPAFFADVTQPTFVMKNIIYTLQTLLGDGVVIFRCYVVWQNIWVVFLPILGWFAVGATGVGCIYSLINARATSGNIFASATGRWITSFYATTLATNLLATILLAYRIWSIDRRLVHVRSRKSPLRPLLEVVVDSGLLYSVTLITALSCFVSASTGQYVVLDMVMPIISIAFYMVIIRVGLAKRDISGVHSTSISTISGGHTGSGMVSHSAGSNYSMNRMQVHITKLTETNNPNMYPYDGRKPSSEEV